MSLNNYSPLAQESFKQMLEDMEINSKIQREEDERKYNKWKEKQSKEIDPLENIYPLMNEDEKFKDMFWSAPTHYDGLIPIKLVGLKQFEDRKEFIK